MTPDSVDKLRAIVRAPPMPTSDAARQTMVGNRRRDSAPELRIRRALYSVGLRYRVDLPIRVRGRRPIRPDLVFTRAKVAVFVDGCFWHGCREHGRAPRSNSAYWSAKIELNRNRDQEQTAALSGAGWTVVRLWEHEPLDRAVCNVVEALGRYAASDSRVAKSACITTDATA